MQKTKLDGTIHYIMKIVCSDLWYKLLKVSVVLRDTLYIVFTKVKTTVLLVFKMSYIRVTLLQEINVTFFIQNLTLTIKLLGYSVLCNNQRSINFKHLTKLNINMIITLLK